MNLTPSGPKDSHPSASFDLSLLKRTALFHMIKYVTYPN